MKKLLIFILMLSAGVRLHAQSVTMREAFTQMPDSLLPYLSHNNRLDLIDFIDSGMKSEVINAFDDTTRLVRLTDDYLRLHLSPVSDIEMKLLPAAALLPDSASQIICMLYSLGEQPRASVARFYTSRWNQVDIPDPISGKEQDLIARPDTMSMELFDVLYKSLLPLTTSASLSETDNIITLTLSYGNVPLGDEKKCINDIIRQITLKWNGEMFKEN